MTRRLSAGTPPTEEANHGRYFCPRCGGYLVRIRRSAADRCLSLFSPVRRYSCEQFSCRWQGNLPVDRRPDVRPPGLPVSFIVSMVLSVAGVILVLVMGSEIAAGIGDGYADAGTEMSLKPQAAVATESVPAARSR